MGAVYDEFERELAALQKRCAGDARQEVIQPFLMALERAEQKATLTFTSLPTKEKTAEVCWNRIAELAM